MTLRVGFQLYRFIALQGDGRGRGMPQWVVSLIIMAACAALSLVMLAINRLIRYVQMRNAGARTPVLHPCSRGLIPARYLSGVPASPRPCC